jgi:hypothetical protein
VYKILARKLVPSISHKNLWGFNRDLTRMYKIQFLNEEKKEEFKLNEKVLSSFIHILFKNL